MYILMGIIQFGFIFAAYLTLNNSVREAARWGSVYIYNNAINATQNDGVRNDGMVDRIIASRGILAMAARGSSTATFSTANNGSLSSPWAGCQDPTNTVLGYWYGAPGGSYPDVTICYSVPSGVTPNDPRRGYYLDVETWYHVTVWVPLLDQFLPNDPSKGSGASQWIRLPGRITVVVN